MKVFVYTKGNPSKKIAVITDVVDVHMDLREKHFIHFITADGVDFMFDIKEVKTTTYQN